MERKKNLKYPRSDNRRNAPYFRLANGHTMTTRAFPGGICAGSPGTDGSSGLSRLELEPSVPHHEAKSIGLDPRFKSFGRRYKRRHAFQDRTWTNIRAALHVNTGRRTTASIFEEDQRHTAPDKQSYNKSASLAFLYIVYAVSFSRRKNSDTTSLNVSIMGPILGFQPNASTLEDFNLILTPYIMAI